MAFPRFSFTKLWTSPADFPTIETDEAQVRADMQALHDEAKDGINSLASALEEPTGASNLGARHPDTGLHYTVQALFAQLFADRHTHSNKSVLDLFTEELKEAYDRLVSLLRGVDHTSAEVAEGDTTGIPTSAAVAQYVRLHGGGGVSGETVSLSLSFSSYTHTTGHSSVTADLPDTNGLSGQIEAVKICGTCVAAIGSWYDTCSLFLSFAAGDSLVLHGSATGFDGGSPRMACLPVAAALYQENGATYNINGLLVWREYGSIDIVFSGMPSCGTTYQIEIVDVGGREFSY